MKRLAAALFVTALAAAALAAWGLAAPSGKTGRAPQTAAAPTKLPPLPSELKARKRWVIGVKCDVPPFGYIDVRGNHAGYDVEIARRFAALAFGKRNRVGFVCVTTPSRIPALQAKRIDIIIATMTFTFARAEVIDFSLPYYGATGRLLVLRDSLINSLAELAGKTVATTRGALYATWIRSCFKDTKLLELDTTTAAFLALKDGRADVFMWDDALLLNLATTDRDVRMTKDKFLAIPWGIGIRKGEAGMKQWVDAALRLMQRKDEFSKILQINTPKRLFDDFKDNVPKPGRSLQYPTPATDPLARCP